jgi:hypothetical protein
MAELRHVRFGEIQLRDEGVSLEIVAYSARICAHGFHGVLKLGRRAALRQRNLPQLREIGPILGRCNACAW